MTPSRLPRAIAVLALIAAGPAALGQAARKPAVATGTAAAGWTVKVDPPAAPATLPGEVTPAVAVPGGFGVLYPTSPGPFVAVGNNEESTGVRQVIDLRTGQPLGAIRGKYAFSDKARLSPDGEYLLDVAEKSKPGTQDVNVWSFKTGGIVQTFQVSDHPAFIYFLDFAGPNRVVCTLSHGGGRFDIYDASTGKKSLTVAGNSTYGHDEAAFSPGRKYLAVPDSVGNHILIYDLASGRVAGDLAPPTNGSAAQRAKALSFSPDGTELCGLFDAGRDTRFVVWTVAKPEIVVDHTFVGDPKGMAPGSFSYKGPAIEWLPDGSAWLLYGHVIFDRAKGRPVWTFRTEKWFQDPGTRKMIDNDRALVVVGPDKAKRLEVVTVPWPKIDAALKAMEGADSASFVRPGGEVSLKVEVGTVKSGTPAAAREELIKVLTARLESDGIKVANGKPAVLHARYGEAAGEVLHEVTRTPGAGPFGQVNPTGRSFQATKGLCQLAWELPDGKAIKAVWRGQVDYNPMSMTIRNTNDINNTVVRDQMFQQLKYQMAGEQIPYFIPKDPSLSMLPGVTFLSDAPLKAANRAVPKATTRGKAAAPASKKP